MSSSTLTSGQVARMLSIPARTIRSYLTTGRLKAEQNPVTGRWRISREALAEFMRDNGLDPSRLSRPLRVLVIDREPDTGPEVRRALNGRGRSAKVEVLADCASALISVGSSPPDLLVLDAATAGDHCWELVEAVRNHERSRNVRVLMLGGNGSAAPDMLRAHARVDKPVSNERLSAVFERILSRVA